MSVEYGRCEVCGKEGPLTRTYRHFPGLECDCCHDSHFDFVRHCPTCIPPKCNTLKVVLTLEQAKLYSEILSAHRKLGIPNITVSVGDTVWYIGLNNYTTPTPFQDKVYELNFEYFRTYEGLFSYDAIGSRIFLTEEDAWAEINKQMKTYGNKDDIANWPEWKKRAAKAGYELGKDYDE